MKNEDYWYLMIIEPDFLKKDNSSRLITIQKSKAFLEDNRRVRYVRAVEEIQLIVDLSKNRIKSFNYEKDPEIKDLYLIRSLINGPLKNKEIGSWIYDACTSVVDLDFWEFMKERKRGKDKKMIEKIKERLRPVL